MYLLEIQWTDLHIKIKFSGENNWDVESAKIIQVKYLKEYTYSYPGSPCWTLNFKSSSASLQYLL